MEHVAGKNFTEYNDKSTAKRGFKRAFPALADQADTFLVARADKWGFWKTSAGAAVLASEAPVTKPKAAPKKAKPVTDLRNLKVPADLPPGNYKATLSDEGEVSIVPEQPQETPAPAPQPEPETPAPVPQVEAAPQPETPPEPEPEAPAAPATDAFSQFAVSQLVGNKPDPQPEQTRPQVVKREKNLPESNGIRRPSAGTICSQIWDIATELCTAEHISSLSEVQQKAENLGINKYTARTQYARWRVFHRP